LLNRRLLPNPLHSLTTQAAAPVTNCCYPVL